MSAAGKEIVIHLPMESSGSCGDYPIKLQCDYIAEEIAKVIIQAQEELPQAVGLSNHEGSRFTSTPEAAGCLARALSGSGLYFLDSITGPGTVAADSAEAFGIPTIRRNVFLDVDMQEGEVIKDRLQQLVFLAERKGCAVGIGHCRLETLNELREFLKSPQAREIEFIKPSEIFYFFDKL